MDRFGPYRPNNLSLWFTLKMCHVAVPASQNTAAADTAGTDSPTLPELMEVSTGETESLNSSLPEAPFGSSPSLAQGHLNLSTPARHL